MTNPHEDDSDDDAGLPVMERSLQIVIDDVRNKRGTALMTVTQLYDKTRSTVAIAFVSDNVDPVAVCHQIAGLSAANLLAARKIVVLEDDLKAATSELKAIKDMYNLP